LKIIFIFEREDVIFSNPDDHVVKFSAIM